MPMRRTSGFLAIVAALALATAARADDVVLAPGSNVKQAVKDVVRGKVQSESVAEVVVRVGQNTVTVPANLVVSIRYDGQPASLTLADSYESNGQLDKAAEQYNKAVADAASRPLIEEAARFKQAEVTADLALADPARSAEAVGLLDAFLRAYPKGRHAPAAHETLARLRLQKGDYPGAEQAIAALANIPQAADRAAVLRARVLAKKGDHARAVEELDRLIASSPEGSPRRREARLAKAESLAGLKKFEEAETDVRAVIKTLPAEDAASESVAYNTLGDCLRAAGRPKDALIAYLHTDLLYSKNREQHPRALAQIAQLWRELKRDDRADEVVQRLRQDYPQSPWLAVASKTP
jgi:tetratricopeptide (TPR) repeat protein